MKNNVSASPYQGYRFPSEIISHSVCLYFRFSLSFRDIEEILAERGVAVTYETIRQWCLKFGQTYANDLKRVVVRWETNGTSMRCFSEINGKTSYLWRAVDQYGTVLERSDSCLNEIIIAYWLPTRNP